MATKTTAKKTIAKRGSTERPSVLAGTPAQKTEVPVVASKPNVKAAPKKSVREATSMTRDVYSMKGTKSGSVTLPESVFGLKWNSPMMHQVVTAMQANARTPVAHTKGRGDVRGGGKKPWQQKGTGRARHGSIRSPIWKGGGVTHGPLSQKDYSQKINKKMRAKALAIALSRKLRDGEILFLDELALGTPSAKDAKALLGALGTISGFEALATRRNNAALLSLSSIDQSTKRSFGNFGNVEVDEVRNLNPVDVLKYKFLVIAGPKEALETLEARMNATKTE